MAQYPRLASSMILPGENILLDAGSTVRALAREMRGFEKLSVTTPGINTMQELAESESIEVDCLGSRLHTVGQSFVGPLTEATLERMSFDRVFLGADAVTAEDGICEGRPRPDPAKGAHGPARQSCVGAGGLVQAGPAAVPRMGLPRVAVHFGD